MRGQATSIQHSHQRSFRSRSTEPFGSCSAGAPNDWRRPYGLPRFGQQQKMPQDKLPTYLQSLHQFRPTKPSHGFTETGLGRLEPMVQNTWKLPDISSLHNADRTGTISFEMCKLLFLQKDIFQPTDQSTHTGQRPSATFGRPVWSAAA